MKLYQSPTFRVLGVPDEGTFADDIVINKKYIYPKPAHLSYHEAAALPLAGLTAYRALMVRANLQKMTKYSSQALVASHYSPCNLH
ncbi:MAG: hypothetical protein IPJ39_21840 [Saprospiraceae bacterium]|nr:hypothetical protein [Saprospiraceae bacterium]